MKTISQHLTAGALAVAGTVATFGLGSVAQAAQLNATLGISPLGAISAIPSGPIANATSIDLAPIHQVNTIPPTYNPPGPQPDAANDFFSGPFAVTLGSAVTLSPDPLSVTIGQAFTASFTTASGPAVFSGSLAQIASSIPTALNLFFLGSITGTGFDPSDASLSFAFTQTAGGAINYSITLASPPEEPPITDVPEPSTMLGILAVAGAGALARRKR